VNHPTRIALALLALTVPLLAGCVAAVGAGAAAGAAAVHDRRTTGTLVDDQIIELKIANLIGKDATLRDAVHVNATSINNVVLLTGETPSEALRRRVVALARGVPKVRRVHDQLTIAAPSSLMARSSDSLITGNVKVALLGNDESSALRIKVVTEAGSVYLMGLVTRAEADAATEVVRRVSGVKRVVRLFEYVE